MGRLIYLERLALGRSAFEDLEPDQQFEHADEDSTQQQFDAKGRPVNPSTEKLNAELCHAQNDVYYLVGVVERLDEIERRRELDHQQSSSTRRQLLEREHEAGKLLEVILRSTVVLMHLWTGAFLERMQVQVHKSEENIMSILAKELGSVRHQKLLPVIFSAFPSLDWILIMLIIKLPLVLMVEQVGGRLQLYIASKKYAKRETARRLHAAVQTLCKAMFFAIDLAIFPVQFEAVSQRLGLAQIIPVWPAIVALWPPFSNLHHKICWRPTVESAPLSLLTSPAAIGCIENMLHQHAWQMLKRSHDHEANAAFTGHRSTVNTHYKMNQGPAILTDPVGWWLRRIRHGRRALIAKMRWDTDESCTSISVPCKPNASTEQSEESDPASLSHVTTHRSTALARLPAKFLALAIDSWLFRLSLLPLHSLFMRSVAFNFIASPTTAKTSLAISASETLYRPFGGGPVAQLVATPFASAAWTHTSTYTCRILIALATDCTVDIVRFWALYRAVRWTGQRWFGWDENGHEDASVDDSKQSTM